MSIEQENFDDLLKSKLDGAEFSFNEANWDKAEQLIIKAEKKRKRRIIGFIFFIGLVLGIGVMVPFIGEESMLKNNVKPEVNNTKNQNTIENRINSENRGVNSNNGGKTNINASEVKENASQVASEHYLANSNTIENKEGVLQKNESPVINSIPSITQKNNSTNAVLNDTRKKEKVKLKKQKSRREEDKDGNNTSTIIENKTDKAVINNNKIEVEKHQETTSIPLKNSPINEIGSPSDSLDVLTLMNSHLTKDTTIVVKGMIVETATDYKPKTFKKVTVFSIDAGANYAFGWANHTIKEANGFNAVFGISASHQFSKKWSVLLGLQYNSLSNLNYSNYTSNNLKYDLGYNQTKTVITPAMFYYLGTPIKLQYHFNEKNSLSIGINALYLLNTNSKIETYTQSTFGAPGYNISKGKGYMDGFSTWDIQPALSYRWNIFKCLSINAEVYYGLIDIKNNIAFNLAKSEHNSGLKLTVSYNLLHK